jgi:hypothetical protein
MSFFDTIKARVGEEAYLHLERAAEKEVALALQMPLVDSYGQKSFYAPRFLLGDLLAKCGTFEAADIKISPIDVINVLFRCKLLYACHDENEYHQRRGGFAAHGDFVVRWPERAKPFGLLVDDYANQLEVQIKERVLLSHISSFRTLSGDPTSPRQFFDDVFSSLGLPFVCFFDDERLIHEYERHEPGLPSYDLIGAARFFSAPAIGFRASGSRAYCFWYSTMWLRTFLNLLRIASYIHPGQRSFGWDVKMSAPTYPVFLGDHATGVLKWDQDKWEPWAKIPDGCLFLSFGYRGVSDMWLDRRTFPGIREFILGHKAIFRFLKNPWNARNLTDIFPTLDILSSASQIPDMGAKILLIYCCLEHLFVPKQAYTENKKYIVGGMTALGPQLIPWFDRLYNLRCAYAHKGYVAHDEKTMELVAASMKNVVMLLAAKLSTA